MAVLFVRLKSPNVLLPIRPCFGALPSFEIILEISDVHGSIGIGVSPLSSSFVILKISDIFVPKQLCFSTPDKGSLTVLHPVFESADVFTAISIGKGPLPRRFAISKIANVYITGKCAASAPGFSTLSSFHVIFESTHIRAAIRIGIGALAVLLVISKFPNIFMPGQCRLWTPNFGPLPRLHIIFKGSGIGRPRSVGIGSLSVLFVLLKRADVFMAS